MKSLGAIIRTGQYTRCIVVFDGKGGSLRRRKIFPEYKNNRKPRGLSLNRSEFSSLEDEQFSMRHQMSRILSYLDVLPVTVLSIDNIEADDTIANIVTSYYENTQNKITIVSSDRDFLQLVDGRITVYNPIKKKEYTPVEIMEEFGLHNSNYLIYRVMTGDSSDNIPGVKGLGLKTLVKEFNLREEHHTVDDILEIARKKTTEKKSKKIFQEIVNSQDKIELNHRLMQLKDSNISLYSKNQIRDILDAPVQSLKKHEFIKMFSDDFLQESIKNPDQWLLNTFSNLNVWTT